MEGRECVRREEEEAEKIPMNFGGAYSICGALRVASTVCRYVCVLEYFLVSKYISSMQGNGNGSGPFCPARFMVDKVLSWPH